MVKGNLDSVDLGIIRILLTHPTMKQGEIAKSVSVSSGTVTNRLIKMRASGLLSGHLFDFSKLCDHKVYRMFFKLDKSSKSEMSRAISYFMDLDFVINVKEVYADHYDIIVDYLIFPGDSEADAEDEGAEVVKKAQILREVPVEFKDSIRLRELGSEANQLSYFELLV
ncbi:MAG TPA: hypothetical protein DD827_07060 [Gammaproteobacteria bacterium]|nr:hypothetical protein [Gammaproteobacteria bacterium]